MWNQTATATAVLSLLAPAPPGTAADQPPPGGVGVAVVASTGAGCPSGSVLTWPMRDNATVVVNYVAFMVRTGPGASPLDFRKSCTAYLQITPPAGYAYAVGQARYFGQGWLSDGASGEERARYQLQGDPAPPLATHTLTGPMDDVWYWSTQTGPDQLAWSPCGVPSTLVLQDDLRVIVGDSDPADTNFLSKDTLAEGAYGTWYDLVWRAC